MNQVKSSILCSQLLFSRHFYELAVIVDHGMREMMVKQLDVFYDVTMMNENYAQPDLTPGSAADIIRGCYKYRSCSRPYSLVKAPKTPSKITHKVTLMGSGAILTEVVKAADQLHKMQFDVDVFSVTGWSELARNGAATFGGTEAFVAQQLQTSKGPIMAATDYVRAVPEGIRAYLPAGRTYTTLGTDGIGRSDTRAALPAFFNIDAASIVKAALRQLIQVETALKPCGRAAKPRLL